MKGGTIRRIANSFKRLMGRPVTTHYKTPELEAPRAHRKKRVRRPSKRGHRSIGLYRLACVPGTITYHDKLVRHFGRRKADQYGRIIQAGQLDLLPTLQEFEDNPPWAFLSTGTG